MHRGSTPQNGGPPHSARGSLNVLHLLTYYSLPENGDPWPSTPVTNVTNLTLGSWNVSVPEIWSELHLGSLAVALLASSSSLGGWHLKCVGASDTSVSYKMYVLFCILYRMRI